MAQQAAFIGVAAGNARKRELRSSHRIQAIGSLSSAKRMQDVPRPNRLAKFHVLKRGQRAGTALHTKSIRGLLFDTKVLLDFSKLFLSSMMETPKMWLMMIIPKSFPVIALSMVDFKMALWRLRSSDVNRDNGNHWATLTERQPLSALSIKFRRQVYPGLRPILNGDLRSTVNSKS